MDAKLSSILASILTLASMIVAVKLLNWAWFRPRKLEQYLRKQGIQGNPYRLIVGDMKDYVNVMKTEQPKTMKFSDDMPSHILPFYHNIIHKFGNPSFVWFGPSPRLNISDPGLIKDVLAAPDVFHKPVPDPIGETIVGGLLYLEDEKWAKHRKILNAAFHLDKLKEMVPAMLLSCSKMIVKWEALVSSDGKAVEIDVWPYLEDLSGDVISKATYGSSYDGGKQIFELQREQVKLVLQLLQLGFIPGWRFFPTKANRRMKVISREIQVLLRNMINQREKAMERGETMNDDDLLGILMESKVKGNQEDKGLSIEDVIEECKLFHLAGSETTSGLLVWTMVMLSKYPAWQARAREEVLQVYGKKQPTFDGLTHLKTVLRMYPPVPFIIRAPRKRVKLGSMMLPVGVEVSLLIGLMHYDSNVWGEDSKEFKPERFSQGISSAAKTPFSFIPFSSGPRVCIGQNFAMIEAKLILAMILQHFSIELSPSYHHAPFQAITLQPQYGAPLLLHKL